MVRTTVVGTYPRNGDTHRKPGLRRGPVRFDRGVRKREEVRAAEREAVAAVVREQAAAGIDVVTDGLVARSDSVARLAGALDGVEVGGPAPYFDTNAHYRQPVVRAAVRWRMPVLLEARQVAQDASRAPVKAVLLGPVTLANLALDRAYGRKRPLALDFAEALAEEVAGLRSAGAQHIQVDEPVLTRNPGDLGLVAEALGILAARKGPAELTLATYFGDVSGIYRDLLEVPADVIGLDLVQGARTWAEVSRRGSEKPLMLGVIDARNPRLEDPGALAACVSGLRDAVPLESS